MRTIRRVGLIAAVTLAFGCTDRFAYRRPDVAPGGILIETPEWTVPAGSEGLYCTYTTVVPTVEILTRELHSYQLPGGHHASLFYSSTVHREAAYTSPHICTEEDMTALRYVGGGVESLEQSLRLPPGVGLRVPAGVQVIIQSHYLNQDPEPHRVKDALVIVPSDPTTLTRIADAFAVNDADFVVPPRTSSYARVLECTVGNSGELPAGSNSLSLLNFLGHTHEYGTHFTADLLRADGSMVSLYNEMAGTRLRNTPPVRNFADTSNPNGLTLNRGDRIRVRCDWNNSTDTALAFPAEMCAGLMYYAPGNGFVACSNVVQTIGGPATDGGTADAGAGNAGCPAPPMGTDPCVRACNTGNEYGVGRYCTAGGGQCSGNRQATICTVDFDPTAVGFCTKPCSSNGGCGSGAMCVAGTGGSGCVPVECLSSPTDGGTDATATDGSADAGAEASMDASIDGAG